MSVIIRLQNLPWSANAADIREFFQGLAIPEGGVHIVGGEMGDAFIAFGSDEDARLAMRKTGTALKGIQISLLLSSRTEMQKVIEAARQQAMGLQAYVAPEKVEPPQPAPEKRKTPAPNLEEYQNPPNPNVQTVANQPTTTAAITQPQPMPPAMGYHQFQPQMMSQQMGMQQYPMGMQQYYRPPFFNNQQHQQAFTHAGVPGVVMNTTQAQVPDSSIPLPMFPESSNQTPPIPIGHDNQSDPPLPQRDPPLPQRDPPLPQPGFERDDSDMEISEVKNTKIELPKERNFKAGRQVSKDRDIKRDERKDDRRRRSSKSRDNDRDRRRRRSRTRSRSRDRHGRRRRSRSRSSREREREMRERNRGRERSSKDNARESYRENRNGTPKNVDARSKRDSSSSSGIPGLGEIPNDIPKEGLSIFDRSTKDEMIKSKNSPVEENQTANIPSLFSTQAQPSAGKTGPRPRYDSPTPTTATNVRMPFGNVRLDFMHFRHPPPGVTLGLRPEIMAVRQENCNISDSKLQVDLSAPPPRLSLPGVRPTDDFEQKVPDPKDLVIDRRMNNEPTREPILPNPIMGQTPFDHGQQMHKPRDERTYPRDESGYGVPRADKRNFTDIRGAPRDMSDQRPEARNFPDSRDNSMEYSDLRTAHKEFSDSREDSMEYSEFRGQRFDNTAMIDDPLKAMRRETLSSSGPSPPERPKEFENGPLFHHPPPASMRSSFPQGPRGDFRGGFRGRGQRGTFHGEGERPLRPDFFNRPLVPDSIRGRGRGFPDFGRGRGARLPPPIRRPLPEEHRMGLSRCVEVLNLPTRVPYKEIKDLFQGIFVPKFSIKQMGNAEGQTIGVALIKFKGPDDALAAVKRSGTYCRDSRIQVNLIDENFYEQSKDVFHAEPMGLEADMPPKDHPMESGGQPTGHMEGGRPLTGHGHMDGGRAPMGQDSMDFDRPPLEKRPMDFDRPFMGRRPDGSRPLIGHAPMEGNRPPLRHMEGQAFPSMERSRPGDMGRARLPPTRPEFANKEDNLTMRPVDEASQGRRSEKPILSKREFQAPINIMDMDPIDPSEFITPCLHVSRLPIGCTDHEVSALFHDFRIKKVELEFEKGTRQPKGGCFVELASPHEADKAIERIKNPNIDGASVDIRKISRKIMYPEKTGKGNRNGDTQELDSNANEKEITNGLNQKNQDLLNQKSHEQKLELLTDSVVVKNLSSDVTEMSIRDFFSDEGLIPEKIVFDRIGCEGRSDAFVVFEKLSDAQRAITKNGQQLGSSNVEVALIAKPTVMAAMKIPFNPIELFQKSEREARESGNVDLQKTVHPAFRENDSPIPNKGILEAPMINGNTSIVATGVEPPSDFGRPGCVVALEHVPYSANTDDIIRFFTDFDGVKPENIIRRYDERNRPTSDARVSLSNPEEARRAVARLNKKFIRTRSVLVSLVED